MKTHLGKLRIRTIFQQKYSIIDIFVAYFLVLKDKYISFIINYFVELVSFLGVTLSNCLKFVSTLCICGKPKKQYGHSQYESCKYSFWNLSLLKVRSICGLFILKEYPILRYNQGNYPQLEDIWKQTNKK